MTANRILQLNAISTAACAIAMLATRGTLYRLFGAESPVLFDVLAAGLLAYAGALAISARQPHVECRTLLAFTAADGVWVAGSAMVLLLFWPTFTPLARILVIAAALLVDVLATLQFRAAGGFAQR